MCSIAAGGLLFGAFDVFDMWFQSRVKSKYTVIAKNIALIVCAAAKVLFIISKAPLIFFVLTNSIEVVIGAVGLVMLYSMSGQSITDFSWSSSLAWQLVKEAWPLAVSGLMIMIYMKIDQIMLAEIAGRHELGIYSAAVRVADPWYFIPAGIISSVFPSLIKAKQENEQKYYQRLQLLYCIITWTGISGSVIMSFLAFPVVKLLYGDQYIGAGEILAINVWVGLFISLGVARSKWLIIENLQRYSLVCLGFGLVVNVILNFLLIPIMQARGAAFSALASQITVAIIAPYFFSKTRISTIMILKSFIPVNEFRQLLRHFKTDSC
jgi:PST family polysaccharide transporter